MTFTVIQSDNEEENVDDNDGPDDWDEDPIDIFRGFDKVKIHFNEEVSDFSFFCECLSARYKLHFFI